jgi:peroxiredoxin
VRDAYEDITRTRSEVVAIGTGDARYAQAFVEEESIPYPVLVDDDAAAARAASVRRGSAFTVLGPAGYRGSIRAWRAGHNVHRPGKRTFQLGATFVIGTDGRIWYEHIDRNTTDHAPIEEVFAALASK